MSIEDDLLKPFTGLRDHGPKPRGELTSYAGTPGAVPAVYYQHPVSDAIYAAEHVGRDTVNDRILDGPEIQAYVDAVLAMPWTRWRGGTGGVRVLLGRDGMATYRNGELHCPAPVRELVVLHELAHFLTAPIPETLHHLPPFVQAYLDLIEGVISPAAAAVFRAAFTAQGVGP